MSGRGRPEPGAGPTVEGYLAEVGSAAARPGPGPGRHRGRAALRAPGRDGRALLRRAAAGRGRPGGDPRVRRPRPGRRRLQGRDRSQPGAPRRDRPAGDRPAGRPTVDRHGRDQPPGHPPRPPWHWTGPSSGLPVGIDLVAVAAGVTAWAALLGIATTGRLTRWLPTRPRRAPTAAAVAGFGAVSADGLGLALLAAQLATARESSRQSWPPPRQQPASPGSCSPGAPHAIAWPSARA